MDICSAFTSEGKKFHEFFGWSSLLVAFIKTKCFKSYALNFIVEEEEGGGGKKFERRNIIISINIDEDWF